MTPNNSAYAFVDCRGSEEDKGCGTQPLTMEQYQRQMSNPHATWRCPCCRGDAWFNDELSEKAMGITTENQFTEAFTDWPASISI
jgi:hypothetical protein